MCSIVKAGAVVFDLPNAAVHKDRRIHAIKKMSAIQAVNRFNTSAVEAPKRDSLVSPPKEAPKPELLLSCIKITAQRRTQRTRKRKIVEK
jgi:hypothetical protein